MSAMDLGDAIIKGLERKLAAAEAALAERTAERDAASERNSIWLDQVRIANKALSDMQHQLDAAQARAERLADALGPFTFISGSEAVEVEFNVPRLKAEYFRAARAALAETESGDGTAKA